ncbi:MAG: COG1361 S-layer family protein, partial [Candidatus Limnocylindria bacterium]
MFGSLARAVAMSILAVGMTVGGAQPAGAWIPAQADLSITKTDSPDPVAPGTNLTYRIQVANAGPDAATAVTVTDVIPVDTRFVSLARPADWTCLKPIVGGSGAVSCTISTLGIGATATFTLVVNVTAGDGATITNTATVGSATTDLNPGNNTATATTKVKKQADLAVTKADAPDPVVAGTDLTYDIALNNFGPNGAVNVSLTDGTPANTTFLSFAQTSGPAFSCSAPAVGGTGTVSCTISMFGAGATATFRLVVRVNASTPNGTTLSNTATVTSDTFDPCPGNNSATATTAVVARADLSVTKSDAPDPVNAGGNITYTINVANAGPSDAQNVSLSDATPANTTFVSITQTAGPAFACTSPALGGTGTVTCTIATFAAGASASFSLVVNVNANTPNSTTISNTATMSSSTTDNVPGNNSATATTTV